MIRKLIQRAGWITGGNVAGQSVLLIATLWLARIYTPVEFGFFAVVLAISNISVALACLRFDVAMPASDERDADSLILLAVGAAVLTSAMATASLWLINASGLIAIPLARQAPLLVFFTILASGLTQASLAWFVRHERFRTVGILRAAQGMAFVAFACFPTVGLPWAHALSMSWGLALLVVAARAARRGGFTHLGGTLRRQWKLPLYSLPGATLDVIGYSMIVWVLITAYGAANAGTYSQLQRLLGGPLMLISISLGQVLLRQTVDHINEPRELRSLISRSFIGLAILTLCAVAAVAALGEPVLRMVLGPQWKIESSMMVLVTVAVGVRACISPLSSVLITLRKFGMGLAWQGLYFISALGLFPLMAARLDFPGFVGFYALHEALLYTVYAALIWRSLPTAGVR